ncbi:MAG: hypothetical protein IKV26_00535 [Paludibacteraceae bacterium]|nr:hypothetical protein [Paludibacteraceae bacterium]
MAKFVCKALVDRPCAWGSKIGEHPQKGDVYVVEVRSGRVEDLTYAELEKAIGKRLTYTSGSISARLCNTRDWEITKL